MPAKFVIKETKGGSYVFNLLAANNEVVLSSETYANKSNAKKGAQSVKTNAKKADRFERRTSKSGQPYFVLKAGNNKIIGQSEMYSSTSAMENGIKAVQKAASSAAIEG